MEKSGNSAWFAQERAAKKFYIFSNFYIAYMLCIFCVLCFIAISIINFKGYKNLLFTGCRFAVASLISGILNLPVLIPLVRAISRTVAIDSSFNYKPELYHSAKEMAMNETTK